MWYFYNKFDNDDLDKLINQINGVFCSIFANDVFEYPTWMDGIRLKEDFETFKQTYVLSSDKEKVKILDAYEKNIQIERLCSLEVKPVSYDELYLDASQEFEKCLNALKLLQNYLYDNLLKLKGLMETVGTLKNYYEKFYDNSIKYVCPFCGLDNMLTSKDVFREAFDHYIPRSKYPFVSLIRENLFPICHTCNSTFKGDKNPRDYGKVFYPFAKKSNDCEPAFDIRAGVIENMVINSTSFMEEIKTWDEVFGIKDRIKNFAEINLNGWMSDIEEAMRSYNVDYVTAKNAEIDRCRSNKMQNYKFIKKAILEKI